MIRLTSFKMPNLKGYYLRVIEATSYLPEGIVVYCIHDDGDLFIVRSSQVYNFVQEFQFDNRSRHKFSTYHPAS